MYLFNHFGLNGHPFSLTPDSRLFYDGAERRDILASLTYAIKRGDGVLKITGEVGSGKTMLCRILLRMLEDEEVVAYLNAPPPDRRGILRSLMREFDLDEDEPDRMMETLNRFLLDKHAEGHRVVLFVDEAQALGLDGLETIRLLSNLETDTHKLLQIVLFGQPELDELLKTPGLKQLSQRITFAFRTRPLGRGETEAYVRHRLYACSSDGRNDHFTRGALRLLAIGARGVPRLVNLLADKAMLSAYANNRGRVTARDVRAAVREGSVVGARLPWWRAAWLPPAVVTAGLLALGAVAYGLGSRMPGAVPDGIL